MTDDARARESSLPFARIVEIAARTLRAPYASIVKVTGDAVEVKAAFGYEPSRGCPSTDPAFCRTVADVSGATVFADLSDDPRFAGARAALGIRSGVALPLVSARGRALGTLCVFDRMPRTFDDGQIELLRAVAAFAAEQMHVEVALREARATYDAFHVMADASPLAVVAYDASGVVTSWNAAAERLYGWAAADAIGARDPALPADTYEAEFGALVDAMRDGATLRGRSVRRRRANGTVVDVRLSAAPLFDGAGRVRRFVAIAEDTRVLELAQRRVALLENVVLLTDVPIAITSVGPFDDPDLLYANDAFARAFGYLPDELAGLPSSALRHDGFAPDVLLRAAHARERAQPLTFEFEGRRKDGSSVWFEQQLSPVFADDGTCEAFVVMLRDVTTRRTEERLLHDRGHVLELIANDAPIANVLQAIVEAAERPSPGASASIMLRRGETMTLAACGERLRDSLGGAAPTIRVGDPDHPCAMTAASCTQIVSDVASLSTTESSYGLMARRMGITTCITTPIRLSNGEVAGSFAQHFFGGARATEPDARVGSELAHLVGIAAERRSDRERLEYLAHHDSLTDLPNRPFFERRLADAKASARARSRRVAVAVCDLDRFKIVNESLGHAAGDRLLREIAARMRSAARTCDLVARFGGDEFMVLIDDVADRDEAASVAQRMLSAVRPSFVCEGREVFVRARMGLALFPDDAGDRESLFALCDGALDIAKARGQDLAFFEPGERVPGTARLALETSLNHALVNGEFRVRYQPVVDVRTRVLRGVEALVRWNHPELGEVLPSAFVHVAEDMGLIVPLGAWVLEEACRFGRRWQDDGVDRFVSVNVSARQFDRRDFVEMVTGVLARTELEAHRLHLEVTESLVMRSPEAAKATLVHLKALGIKISIDDFGTGYSSFNYLKRFPLDALKIDRLFVRDIGGRDVESNDEAIVRAIVGVARALDLRIVAEGVETESELAFLRALDVPYAQGFLFAPALDGDEAYAWRAPGTAARTPSGERPATFPSRSAF